MLRTLSLSTPHNGDSYGLELATAGDWNGDGQRGRVEIYRGQQGKPAFVAQGESGNVNFGRFFASFPGDFNGDQVVDLYLVDFEANSGSKGGGQIRVLSGFDATGMGDLNHNGQTGFLITGAWSNSNGTKSGRVYVISG